MRAEDTRGTADGVPVDNTGAPFSLPGAGAADALDAFELAAVLERVAGHAAGELGAAAVRQRRPLADPAAVRAELAAVAQAAGLIREGRGLAPEPVPEIARILARLQVDGSVLEGLEFLALRRTLAAIRLVASELTRVEADAPLVSALRQPAPDRSHEALLDRSIDGDGTVLDGASPRLAAARRDVQVARERLVRKLEVMLRGLGAGAGEGTVTLRAGRYVIPVRRDARQRPSGIVHDESASGGTLFVEPADAIDLGNSLREAEVAEDREVLRVLRDLSDRLRPEAGAVARGHAMCVAVDSLVARARYAVAVDGSLPEVYPAPGPLLIRRGRHPLLAGVLETVVPFDLDLMDGERTLLVSGPNTGGKTVLLKAVGLFALMAQSGVIPPVGLGTRLPVFGSFFADIGDRQSIAASLSTFSAHVQVLRGVLERADAASLVLLDELGSGTDPSEGAALAAAALRSLTARGACTLASTHLGALKELQATTPGVVNGSLEFDAATLSPTYRFIKGLPGRSYGLAIARRLGVPGEVLRDAEARVPDAERHLDALLAAVERRERELLARESLAESRAAGLEALEARLASQALDQERRDSDLRRRERDAEKQARQDTRAYLLDARRRVEDAIAGVRRAAEADVAREARRGLEQAIQAEAAALQEVVASEREDRPPPAPLAVGMRVRVGNGGIGRVQDLRPDGRVAVTVGSMRMVVEAGLLSPVAGEDPESRPPRPVLPAPAADLPSEIDLRGMTGDEAEAAALAAVDAAVLAERPFLRIIHGMGTGVVRERVRQVVQADPRVARFAFAPAHQGGRGVTLVEFAD